MTWREFNLKVSTLAGIPLENIRNANIVTEMESPGFLNREVKLLPGYNLEDVIKDTAAKMKLAFEAMDKNPKFAKQVHDWIDSGKSKNASNN